MLFFHSLLSLAGLGLLNQAVRAQDGPPELYYQVLFEPTECEQKTQHGDRLTIDYTASKYNGGEVIDSTLDEGREPWKYTMGFGHVINGVERGTIDMCVHQIRRIYIPAEFAYGKDGNPPGIPPDTHLIYEVHLLAIERDGKVWGTPAPEAPPLKFDLPLSGADFDLNIPPIEGDPPTGATPVDAAAEPAVPQEPVAEPVKIQDDTSAAVPPAQEGAKHDEL